MLASELPVWYVRTFAFALGALLGSFANVVIYRWPRELSIVRPGSHCMSCKSAIRPYDNVPIFAWFWLRGRCRKCGAKFSFRYPLVELICGAISAAIAERVFFGPGATLLAASSAFAVYGVRETVALVLLIAAFIDLDEMIVPWFIKWFAIVPVVGAALLPVVPPAVPLVPALGGAALGYLGMRILFVDGYKLLTGRRGMGLGDPEIMLLVGALLGPTGVLFALGAGAAQGTAVTLVAIAARARIGPEHADDIDEDEPKGSNGPAKLKVPFVPFLALAALEYMLGADRLVEAYLRWFFAG